MPSLVLVRHGQSQWNLENKFTGWVDVDLSPKGEEEARIAGHHLKNYKFTKAFTSDLLRAQRTLEIILNEIGQPDLPIVKDKALNERMYGDLQGLDKKETAEKFGDEQVHIWRRSYDIAPPNGESLKDTADRVLPFYKEQIEPELRKGGDIIISAYGNSLRALLMYLENISPEDIVKQEIPTGSPKLYQLDDELRVLDSRYLINK